MKKTYIIPELTIVMLNVKHHLMDLSDGGSASILNGQTDGDGFVKENNTSSRYNVWDDDWSN